MEIVISVAVAYLLCGVAQVVEDLTADPIRKPTWAWRPTVGKVILAAAIWFMSPLVAALYSGRLAARRFALALVGDILQMSVLTVFVWGCITLSEHILDRTVLQVFTTAVVVMVGTPLVLRLLNLLIALMTPLIAIVALPLALIFPVKEPIEVREIRWCRNCKHYRKSREYEDVLKGLWQSVSMPRSDRLPCDIALETAGVWERYFGTEPRSRTLFPKDCAFFDQHGQPEPSKRRGLG